MAWEKIELDAIYQQMGGVAQMEAHSRRVYATAVQHVRDTISRGAMPHVATLLLDKQRLSARTREQDT